MIARKSLISLLLHLVILFLTIDLFSHPTLAGATQIPAAGFPFKAAIPYEIQQVTSRPPPKA